jgi:hypothetical protein
MSYDPGMSLHLPGEPRIRLLEVLLAVVAVLGLCALGCAAPGPQTRRYPASVFEAARYEARHEPAVERAPRPDEGAAFVVRTLHAAGLRFGTDGSTRALWGYLRTSHRLVPAAAARPGDVLFFDTRGTGDRAECADHAAVVERVTGSGRIAFVEVRGGRIRHSFVDPAHPASRRDDDGSLLNSFLRPMRPDDPPGTRHLASQMLCAVVRL